MDTQLESVADVKAAFENSNQQIVNLNSQNESLLGRIEVMEARAALPSVAKCRDGGPDETKEQFQYRAAFEEWVRHPQDGLYANRLSEASQDLGKKDVTIGTDSQGGYAVPEQISNRIEKRVIQLNPFRQLVSVQKSITGDYKQLVDMLGFSAGWVGETGTRSATNTADLRERAPTFGEQYAYPQVSEWAMDDVFFDIGEWLTNSVADEFSVQEANAIVSGNGSNKPTGFLNTDPVSTADSASPMRAAGVLQYMGITGSASPIVLNYATLVDMIHMPKERYVQGDKVAWVMNRTTLAAVQKIVDTTGQPIWQPSLIQGTPSMLLGFPVHTSDSMPTFAVDGFCIGFGAWNHAYLLVDRTQIRIGAEGFTNPGYVRFYVRRRVGGCVLNNEAVKMLRISD